MVTLAPTVHEHLARCGASVYVDGLVTGADVELTALHRWRGKNRPVSAFERSGLRAPVRNGNTTNVHGQIQIEMVAKSKEKLWSPRAEPLDPTVAIMLFVRSAWGYRFAYRTAGRTTARTCHSHGQRTIAAASGLQGAS